MCAFTTLEDFITIANAHKVIIVILETLQLTQAMSFLEVKPKIILKIGCAPLAPSMAIILSIHALHLQRLVSSQKHRW
jgi:hypothetical protein